MQSVAGGKGILGFAGQGDAAQMTFDGEAVGPFLINEQLNDVRQNRGRKRARENVSAEAALGIGRCPGENPSHCRQCEKQMFIRTPCERFSDALGSPVGLRRNLARDRFVKTGRMDGEQGHFPIHIAL